MTYSGWETGPSEDGELALIDLLECLTQFFLPLVHARWQWRHGIGSGWIEWRYWCMCKSRHLSKTLSFHIQHTLSVYKNLWLLHKVSKMDFTVLLEACQFLILCSSRRCIWTRRNIHESICSWNCQRSHCYPGVPACWQMMHEPTKTKQRQNMQQSINL